MKLTTKNTVYIICTILGFTALSLSLKSCNFGASKNDEDKNKALALPALKIDTTTAFVVKDYIGTIEGKLNVEIRSFAEGILEEIYVDEGDYVEKGQALFKINPLPYQEILNNSIASENVEKAKLKNAQLEIDRLQPLIDNEVIAPVQLQSAIANYEVAKASLASASAAVASAKINLGFTLIKAPISGYIGRIPKRVGNLNTKGDKVPLTVLTDVSDVYVYFSMSESDYLYFTKNNANDSIKNSLGSIIPEAKLILADGKEYNKSGIVDAVNGQVDRSTGSISLRATFPNSQDIMRSGNTGTIKLRESKNGVILVPQEATTTIQDKIFVYLLNKDNTVKLQEIKVDGTANKKYIVVDGLAIDDVIILTGFNKFNKETIVNPIL
ncbi:efflux RND transporter periplasmic adaptor subunit [Flavobacterium agricola]|uniref:Efflux RND transporter periplasmic adaptor subunit n=1 Tax=Flavobacterium agricola TaxID=2870839 RepID=A0ABY6M3F6_9FLAO|nr:efflux RND transporter periplasmic adaptor subunit [Flavobacterium agricola]UYW01746.1 efflux RND transporter periplasmic adaptor subunit [Flavobacterium agricola]